MDGWLGELDGNGNVEKIDRTPPKESVLIDIPRTYGHASVSEWPPAASAPARDKGPLGLEPAPLFF